MKKQKFKVNILDVAIIAVIICSVSVLIFKDWINEFFEEPSITEVNMIVTVSNPDPSAVSLLTVGMTTETVDKYNSETKINGFVDGVEYSENGTLRLIFACDGYERFGRIYSQNGTLLKIGGEYVLTLSENNMECKVDIVQIGK